jgi:hypothetical protein
LWVLVFFTAMFVIAACASSNDDSNSHADKAISMLSLVKNSRGSPWGAEALSLISSSTASTTATATSRNSDAVALVPWLVNLGRSTTAYSTSLHQIQAGATMLTPQVVAASQWHLHKGPIKHDLRDVAAALHGWLQSSTASAQLAAAGYRTQRVIELLQSIVQAGQDAPQARPAAAAAAAAAVTPQLLQQLGLALCNMPVGTACNNACCTSLAGLSEQQLVVGRARVCAGCLVARYCCQACQSAAWKQHKPARLLPVHALPSLLSRLLEQLHWHGVLQVCVARDLGVGVLRMSGLFVWLRFWQCAWVMCMALVALHVWQLVALAPAQQQHCRWFRLQCLCLCLSLVGHGCDSALSRSCSEVSAHGKALQQLHMPWTHCCLSLSCSQIVLHATASHCMADSSKQGLNYQVNKLFGCQHTCRL